MHKDSSFNHDKFSLEAKRRLAPEKVQEFLRRYRAGLLPSCIVEYFQLDKWEEIGPWGWHVVKPEDKPKTSSTPSTDRFLRLVKD